jgi:Undecaprenyl-phosphate glucose phosphotransferase
MAIDDVLDSQAGRAMLGGRTTRVVVLTVQHAIRLAKRIRFTNEKATFAVSHNFEIACAVGADVVALALSAVLVSWICADLGVVCARWQWVGTDLVAVIAAVDLQRRCSAYSFDQVRNIGARVSHLMLASLLAASAGTVCLVLWGASSSLLQLWLVVWAMISTVTGALAVLVSTLSVRWLCASGRLTHNVAVVGTSDYAKMFVRGLCADQARAIRLAGLFTDDDEITACRDTLYTNNVRDLAARVTGPRIDSIVLCVPIVNIERVARLRAQLRGLNCNIYLADKVLDLACATGALDQIGQQRVIKIDGTPLNVWQVMQKTAFDRVAAALGLIVTIPLLAIIALAIRLDSAGPILFRQPRLGFNNCLFTMFKFRTMYHHQADLRCAQQTTRNDPRVTRVGRFLRRTSLDELPQLLNVLAGDMSLVGPRPHAPDTKAGGLLFHEAVADYRLRHRVKPGITGWAQINGWRGETSTRTHIEQRVAHDLYYIDNWSMLLDLRIMVLTLVRGFNSKQAF